MNHITAALNMISFLSVCLALIALARGWKRTAFRDARWWLLGILVLGLFLGLYSGLVWLGFIQPYVAFEDFVRILLPILWGFLFYIFQRDALEGDLRESEERYRRLVETSPDAITLTDLRGKILLCNQQSATLQGFESVEQMVGRSAFEFVAPEDMEYAGRNAQKTLQTGWVRDIRYTALKAGGERFPVNLSASVIKNIAGVPVAFIGVTRDITAQVRAEETLAHRLAFERAVANISSRFVGVVEVNEAIRASLEELGRLVGASRAYFFLFRKEIGVVDNTHEWCAQGTPALIHKLQNQPLEKYAGLIDRLHKKDIIQVDVEGLPDEDKSFRDLLQSQGIESIILVPLFVGEEISGFLGFDNVTRREALNDEDRTLLFVSAGIISSALERDRAEVALSKSEEKFRSFVELSPDAVILTDEQGTIIEWNRAAEQLTGVEREQAHGRPIWEVQYEVVAEGQRTPEHVARTRAVLDGLLQRGDASRLGQTRESDLQRADGLHRVIQTVEFVVPTEVGFRIGNITRDITHRKQAEADLLQANERLEQALAELKAAQETMIEQERLAAVGQLAAGIAHDFNNLLMSITLYSEIMLNMQDLSPQYYKMLETILDQARQGARLTQQILDFSRRSVMQMQPLDLAQHMEKFAGLLRRVLPESILIELDYDGSEGGYCINGDAGRIEQALMNLSLNARDAMPAGGRLCFVLGRMRFSQAGAPYVEMSSGDWVLARVIDTGSGISPEHLPHIFEPFFTTKQAGKGAGLGLAQVYGIVKGHQGHIEVNSQLGAGTTFCLYFPALL